jgi:broad-specificity NMP kinase
LRYPDRPDVIVVRGAPAVGKSTVSRLLLSRLEAGALVEVDQIRGSMANVDWGDREQHAVALRGALSLVESLVSDAAIPVVLVDVMGRDSLQIVQDWLDRANVSHVTYSLWAERGVLEARMERREGDYRDHQMARWINEEIERDRRPAERLVDTSATEPAEIVIELIRAVGGKGVIPR